MPDPSDPDDLLPEPEAFYDEQADLLENLDASRTDYRVLAGMGAVLCVLATGLGAYALQTVRLGVLDLGDEFLYLSNEPVWFYGFVGAFAGFALALGGIGLRMILHAQHSRRQIRKALRDRNDALPGRS